MDKSIVANDDRYENDNANDGNNLPISMIPCPDCENLVPATNLELHRLRACPSNSEANGNNGGRYRGTKIPALNLATSTNIFTVADKNNRTEDDDDDDDDSVVVMTTMADSSSRRPRKTRRGNINNTVDTMIQSSPSSSSLEEEIGSNYNDNDNSNRNNEEDEIIDLMDESDISSDPLRPVDASIGADVSARTVDLTGNSEEDEEEDDRKLPARDTTTDSNPSDNHHRSDDEWSCPQCTLLNKNTSSRCDACQYFNSELQHRLIRNAYTSREDHNIPEPSLHPRQQRPVSAPSSLSFIGSGALLGAAVGMAGNWVHGRNPLSGAFEGGTTGAMGGALLHEVLQNNNNDNSNNNYNNSDHETATTSAPVGAAAYTRHNRDAIESTLTRSLSHYVEGGTSSRNSSSSNYSNAAPARYSISTGGSGYPTANTRNDSMNASTNSDVSPFASRPRPRANNNPNTYVHLMSSATNRDRNGEARMNLLLYQQLQTHGNRDRASFGGSERNLSGEYSNHQLFLQLRTLQLLRELNTRSSNNQNDIDEMNYEQLLNAFGDGTENMGAEEGEIRRLPTHVVGDNPLPEDARQCLICLEDFEKGESRTILPCLHSFHQNCCNKWLRTNGKCPVCKHPISSNG
jgi:hypothetical protein